FATDTANKTGLTPRTIRQEVQIATNLDEEHWTQERIAQAKGVDRSFVAKRLKLNELPTSVKQHVNQGLLSEAHLLEIMAVCVDSHLYPWLTTQQAWEELAAKAVYDKGKNGDSLRKKRRS